MSVVTDALSVIVRCKTLEQKYPGGMAAYMLACPNRTFCADRFLTRIGFMSPARVEEWIEHLIRHGIQHCRGLDLIEIAVVDQFQGYMGTCDWLEGGPFDNVPRVWLKGTQEGELAAPDGWTPEKSASLVFTPNEEVHSRLLSLGAAGNVHAFLDFKTGHVTYSADEIPIPRQSP